MRTCKVLNPLLRIRPICTSHFLRSINRPNRLSRNAPVKLSATCNSLMSTTQSPGHGGPKTLAKPPSEIAPDTFKDGLSGHCLCGSIHVTIKDQELFSGKRRGHLCHCANCRKVAGSYVASNLLIEEEKVTIEDRNGTFKFYKDGDTISGNKLERWFCGECGNPIKSVSPNFPGKVILKMGIYPRIPEPEAEAFSVNRQSWEGRHKDVKMYATKNFGDPYTGDL